MDIFELFKHKIINIVNKLPLKLDSQFNFNSFQVNFPKAEKFGDLSTNIALVLGKTLGVSTTELAQSIADKILTDEKNIIKDVDIVAPGFINITFKRHFWLQLLNSILMEDMQPQPTAEQSANNVNIEYVSANPTGPMHIGHGRGAVIGDVLANLYLFFGFPVTKEYYINDAGNQIRGLALSVYYRYCKALGITINKPVDFYPGMYVTNIAQEIIDLDGDKWLERPETEFVDYFSIFAVKAIMAMIRDDLKLLGVNHDVFSSERTVCHEDIYVNLKQTLTEQDLLYEGTLEPPKGTKPSATETKRLPHLLFRSSKFGDSSDRVVEKTDKTRSYFANDIVYHHNKITRGFNEIILLLGADHKGYEKRLRAVVTALSDNTVTFKPVFVEMVNLLRDKKPVRMSKRAGEFVTLKEVLAEVPRDAFRIMMISRSNTSTLDFDLSTVVAKTDANPVFYIQYSYARIHSVINNAKKIFDDLTEEQLINADKSLLSSKHEINLIKELASCHKTLKTALNTLNVHLIFLLLLNIAKSVHTWWGAGKHDSSLMFIQNDNKNLTFARLSLLLAAKKVMVVLFDIIGIDKTEHM